MTFAATNKEDTAWAFLLRHWKWILILGSVNWVAWYGFERIHNIELGYRDLWPLRFYLLSGLLLFDNLCVLWWYANLTEQQKEAAKQQLRLAKKDYIERNKPVVYSDRWEHPEKEGDFCYVIRNVGGGGRGRGLAASRPDEGQGRS